MKIYTKTGDRGMTSLANGGRVSKADQRVEAYGTIDELMSFLGLLATKLDNPSDQSSIQIIQKTLFLVGGEASGLALTEEQMAELKSQTSTLEKEIDRMQTELPPLKSFIIPGSNETSALAHVCRTICRRAERNMINCQTEGDSLVYLNRLSDYLFVLARFLTKKHKNI